MIIFLIYAPQGVIPEKPFETLDLNKLKLVAESSENEIKGNVGES